MAELPDAMKASHAEVNYGPSTVRDRCGRCVHFIAPRRCESVRTPVNSAGWCIRFQADTTAKAA